MAAKKSDKQKTHTLLLWHEFPENVHLYLLPNEVADKYRETLEQAQGKYANTRGENSATSTLINLIYPIGAAEKSEWQQYQLLEDVIKDVCITYVYTSGMAL